MAKQAQKTHQIVRLNGKEWERKTSTFTVSCYEKDVELLDWLTEYLGCSRSEAVRSAVRLACAQFANLPQSGTT